jgi:hypothetical protein
MSAIDLAHANATDQGQSIDEMVGQGSDEKAAKFHLFFL